MMACHPRLYGISTIRYSGYVSSSANPLNPPRLPADLRRPDISATTSETLATCSVAPLIGPQQLKPIQPRQRPARRLAPVLRTQNLRASLNRVRTANTGTYSAERFRSSTILALLSAYRPST